MGGFIENMMKSGMESMVGGDKSRSAPQNQSANPLGDNPLGKMMEDFLGGAMGGNNYDTQTRETYRQEREAPRSGTDIFGEMFETGRKMNEGYQKNMESIFDQYLDGMKRR